MNLPGVYKTFLDRWANYQTCWLISDTHFGENDLKKAYLNRPSDDEFISKINSKVGRKDLLIHLGDVGDLEYMKKVRGHKILIAGNHESGLEKYKETFELVFPGPVMFGEKLLLSHEPIPGINWALNVHGHNHNGPIMIDNYHFNINCDANQCYMPINFNTMLKRGLTAHIKPFHRSIIDKATAKKRKEENSK